MGYQKGAMRLRSSERLASSSDSGADVPRAEEESVLDKESKPGGGSVRAYIRKGILILNREVVDPERAKVLRFAAGAEVRFGSEKSPRKLGRGERIIAKSYFPDHSSAVTGQTVTGEYFHVHSFVKDKEPPILSEVLYHIEEKQ